MQRARRTWWKWAVLTALPIVPLWMIAAKKSWLPRFIDTREGAPAGTLVESHIKSLAWSPDSRILAIAATILSPTRQANSMNVRTEVQLWDVAHRTKNRSSIWDGDESNYALAWSLDGSKVAGLGSSESMTNLYIWNTQRDRTPKKISRLSQNAYLQGKPHLLWDSRGKTLAALYAVATGWAPAASQRADVVERHDTSTAAVRDRKVLYRNIGRPDRAYECGALSPDASQAVILSRPGKKRDLQLLVFNTKDANCRIFKLPVTLPSTLQPSLIVAPTDIALVLTHFARLDAIDSRNGTARYHIKTESSLSSFALSPDGTLVATQEMDGTLALWDAHTGRQIRKMGRDRAHVYTPLGSLGVNSYSYLERVAFSPDSSTLAVAEDNGTVTLWRVH